MANRSSHLEAEQSASNINLEETSDDSILDCSLKIEWLNSEEAARLLRISVKALRNMTSNGQLPFYKLGRRNRYRKDELETLLRSQKRGNYGN
ncbi:MAG: helix-turn-helix domain-containing protein [Bdellovibrio sp.]